MAESDPIDTGGPSDNLLELQSFQNLGLEQLGTVRALREQGGNVHVHLHQHTVNHNTVVKGDVVKGSKTDVKDSAIETLLSPTGDSSNQGHLQSQALLEPFIQDALPWADGEERETEVQQQRAQILSGQQSHSQDQRERFKATDKVETLDVHSQTNEQSLLHSAIMDGLVVAPSLISALKMIQLYKNEKTKQDVCNLLPFLETTWKSMQVKIILKSIENQLVPGREIQLKEQNLSAFISRVDEVYRIGIQYASENNFIHAVISFFAAANLHRIADKNNNSVNGIHNCVSQVCSVVEKMAKQPGVKVMVIDHVIPLMHEMKDNIRFISSSSRDIKVVMESHCLRDIGSCYYYCDEYQQHANMNEYAIELLKKHFNNKAAKYCVYANCLNNAGLAYYYLGEIEKSIEKYKMSMKAYGEANDWPSDEYKTDAIARTEDNLKTSEAKLRK